MVVNPRAKQSGLVINDEPSNTEQDQVVTNNTKANNQSTTSIVDLDMQSFSRLGEYLSSNDRFALAHCHLSLFQVYYPQVIRDFQRVVLSDNKELALDQLQKKPRLLTDRIAQARGIVIDKSGKAYKEMSALQIALCLWDIELVIKMREIYLAAYPHNGQAEIDLQIREIFPRGVEVYRQSQTAFDISGLVDVITKSSSDDLNAALAGPQNGSQLCAAIANFRENFKSCCLQEKVFNPQHLIAAFKSFKENVVEWNQAQRNLFWRQVIGYMQRFMPLHCALDQEAVADIQFDKLGYDFALCNGREVRNVLGDSMSISLILAEKTRFSALLARNVDLLVAINSLDQRPMSRAVI